VAAARMPVVKSGAVVEQIVSGAVRMCGRA